MPRDLDDPGVRAGRDRPTDLPTRHTIGSVFVTNLAGQTSWFASPMVFDLDGNGSNELVAAYYDIYVFASNGNLLHRAQDGDGRVYAPHVVADLDLDGKSEVVGVPNVEMYEPYVT